MGEFRLLPSDALLHQMFALSPSSSVCSVVLLVQVITFEYRYGRIVVRSGTEYQDFGFVR